MNPLPQSSPRASETSDSEEVDQPDSAHAQPPRETMLRHLALAFVGRWHWIALCLILGVLGASYHVEKTPKRYTATTTLLIKERTASVMSRDQVDEINLSSQEAMNTVVAQIRRVTLLERVASRQDVRALTGVVPPPVDWVPACLRGKLGNFAATAVATSPPPVITGGMLDGWLGVAVRRGTRLLDISVTHQVPEVAKALADAVACQYLAEIGNSNTKGRSKVILLLEGETKEARAKYHTVAQIANVTAHPILGAIPEIKLHHLAVAEKHFRKRHPGQLANLHESWEKRVVFRSGTASTSYVEMYRSLRASVSRLGDESKRKITLFSSALPGEGKSLTSANFAAAAAGQGRKTLHIDMDLRKPAVHKIFGLSREQEHGGITECLANLAPFEEVTRRPSASPRRAGSSPV